jgi:hypothetical protein
MKFSLAPLGVMALALSVLAAADTKCVSGDVDGAINPGLSIDEEHEVTISAESNDCFNGATGLKLWVSGPGAGGCEPRPGITDAEVTGTIFELSPTLETTMYVAGKLNIGPPGLELIGEATSRSHQQYNVTLKGYVNERRLNDSCIEGGGTLVQARITSFTLLKKFS